MVLLNSVATKNVAAILPVIRAQQAAAMTIVHAAPLLHCLNGAYGLRVAYHSKIGFKNCRAWYSVLSAVLCEYKERPGFFPGRSHFL